MDTAYPERTIALPAAELTSGDEFPSHDGYVHFIDGVSQDGGTVTVNVSRGMHRQGGCYSTEFPADHIVHVLA